MRVGEKKRVFVVGRLCLDVQNTSIMGMCTRVWTVVDRSGLPRRYKYSHGHVTHVWTIMDCCERVNTRMDMCTRICGPQWTAVDV